MVEALPRQFGSYVLERRLGVGGMAETFVARRAAYDGVEQRVCLKRVLPAFNQDPTFVRQFQREAKLAGRLRHSHVVGVLDFGEHEGEQYMALELVDGVDLRALLASSEDGRLPPALAALIALDLAYALEYAHEQGVVHRDVTPSNVLLSQRGEVKLADFGVAKALTGATVATASGFVKGKVPYMAPEQMRGTDVDGRADVFSLGVTLFEMLAGRRPFVGQHDVEVMMKILEGERATLREVAPEVPEALAAAVEGCLHTDREQRWDDAGALIDALTPALGSPKARDTLAERVRQAHAVPAEPLGTRDTELAEVPEAARAAADVPATMASAPAADARGRLPTPGAALDSQQPAPRLSEETPARPAGSRRGLVVAAALLLLGGAGVALAVGAAGGDEPEVAAPTPVGAPASEAAVEAAGEAPPEPVPAELPSGVVPPELEESEPAGPAEGEPAERSRRAAVERPARARRAARRADAPTTMTANPPVEAAPEPAVASAPAPAMTEPAPEPTPEPAPTPMREAPGTVRVSVVPYGSLWVDGRRVGDAPMNLELEPGAHRIGIGRGRPEVTRRVRIRSGRATTPLVVELPGN